VAITPCQHPVVVPRSAPGVLCRPMATLVEFLAGDSLAVRKLEAQDKKKLSVSDPRGKRSSLAPDKVLFRHGEESIERLEQRLEALAREVDIPLLWESSLDELGEGTLAAAALADLYFGASDDLHASAMFRALCADKLHFRRRATLFEARSPEELRRLREQRESQERTARAQADLEDAFRHKNLGESLAARLLRHLRGGDDKLLERALYGHFSDPAAGAFNLLVGAGYLPPTASLEVLQAGLKEGHPDDAVAHAARVTVPPAHGPVLPAAFSIDDPDTREVDDVLSARQQGPLVRVDIDIADVASLVLPGDPVDLEAARRATTIYLPTGVFYMLPPSLGCGPGSLTAGEERGAVRHSVFLDPDGEVHGFEISRVTLRVGRRLSYEEADQILADPTSDPSLHETLALLQRVAEAREARRREAGALIAPRREWKIQVRDQGKTIEVQEIPSQSPSRSLVAEMMILTNNMAAREATRRGIPMIFRAQDPPAEPLPEVDPRNPALFETLHRFIKPAALSLNPSPHWALGVDAYTQVTSPLRRYADLVAQRQLCAALDGRDPPSDTQQLLKVLATAEATEKEAKRLEATVKERWALEVVARLEKKQALLATVMGEHPAGGHRVQLHCSGARGVLMDDRRHEPGSLVRVSVKSVRPGKGLLRVLPED